MNILALLPESIGDFLLTTPSLQALQRYFAKDTIFWFHPPTLNEIACLVPLQAERFSADQNILFQLTVCFPPAAKFYWMARRFGGKKRIGYAHQKMWIPRLAGKICLTDCWVCPSNSALHELEAYGKILDILKIPFQPEIPELKIPQENLEAAKKWIPSGITMAIHLNARWPDNPLKFLKKMTEENSEINILALYRSTEASAAKQFLNEEKVKRLYDPGPSSLATYAALVRQSHLMIAVDGGPVHLASAVKTPVLAFYPEKKFHRHAAQWHPWGVPYRALPLTPQGLEHLPSAAVKILFDKSRETDGIPLS